MASASAWTEAFACQQIHYAKAAASLGTLKVKGVGCFGEGGKKIKLVWGLLSINSAFMGQLLPKFQKTLL